MAANSRDNENKGAKPGGAGSSRNAGGSRNEGGMGGRGRPGADSPDNANKGAKPGGAGSTNRNVPGGGKGTPAVTGKTPDVIVGDDGKPVVVGDATTDQINKPAPTVPKESDLLSDALDFFGIDPDEPGETAGGLLGGLAGTLLGGPLAGFLGSKLGQFLGGMLDSEGDEGSMTRQDRLTKEQLDTIIHDPSQREALARAGHYADPGEARALGVQQYGADSRGSHSARGNGEQMGSRGRPGFGGEVEGQIVNNGGPSNTVTPPAKTNTPTAPNPGTVTGTIPPLTFGANPQVSAILNEIRGTNFTPPPQFQIDNAAHDAIMANFMAQFGKGAA